jgi:4a-hydroxytetrahydrobiopterin dehydratase
MMKRLTQGNCEPCKGGMPPLTTAQVETLLDQVKGWDVLTIAGVPRLTKVFRFSNFARALKFTNQVGELAEAQGHHPALLTEWGVVTVSWWTHKIKGLHRNDFIMAAKTDELTEE